MVSSVAFMRLQNSTYDVLTAKPQIAARPRRGKFKSQNLPPDNFQEKKKADLIYRMSSFPLRIIFSREISVAPKPACMF